MGKTKIFEFPISNKKKKHEMSHEQIFLTHEHDCSGEFHLANEIKIINR